MNYPILSWDDKVLITYETPEEVVTLFALADATGAPPGAVHVNQFRLPERLKQPLYELVRDYYANL